MVVDDAPRALWEGYGQPGATRRPSEICVTEEIGRALAHLVEVTSPLVVVEVGTGLGVSGAHLLAPLEAAGRGHLYTFEANPSWAQEAAVRLRTIGSRFSVITGRFEDRVDAALLGQRIDLAFIDAIHTDAELLRQWAMVEERCAPAAVVAIDDVNATPSAWRRITSEASPMITVGHRLGVVRIGKRL